MSARLQWPHERHHGPSRAILGLSAGLALLAGAIPANAFDFTLPEAEVQASEGCCGIDEDRTFRGYAVELWDEAPTISELDCPDQDDACLLNEVDQISRLLRLREAVVRRASLERAQHFGEGPLVAVGFALQ